MAEPGVPNARWDFIAQTWLSTPWKVRRNKWEIQTPKNMKCWLKVTFALLLFHRSRRLPLINRNINPKTRAMTHSLKGTRQNDVSIKTIVLPQCCGYKYSEYSKTASQNASMGKAGLSPGKQWKPVAVNETQNAKRVLPIATMRKALCTANKAKGPSCSHF